jgi:putative flippase GtrA
MLRPLSRAPAVRFTVVGLAMTVLHLLVFRALSAVTIPELANSGAFVVATQVNFALSYCWTWSTRRQPGGETPGRVASRAVLFNASASAAFLVNAAVFAAAHRLAAVEPLPSALVATAVSACASFVVSSRLTFARSAPVAPLAAPAVAVAPLLPSTASASTHGDPA